MLTHTLYEIFSWQLSPQKVHLQYMYTCIVGRECTLTVSWVDSAAAVHEAAATLEFTLKKVQKCHWCLYRCFCRLADRLWQQPQLYVFDKLRGITCVSISVVVGPL